MANTRITEKKWVNVRRSDCTNPIYLAFRDNLSGVDYWLFEGNRRIEDVSSDVTTFQKAYQDLENTSYITATSKSQRQVKITLQASQLTDDEYNGLMELISSRKIQILTNPSTWQIDGPEWPEVNVVQGSHSVEVIQTLKTLTFTIVLQPILTTSR
jgi:hypothetical protein